MVRWQGGAAVRWFGRRFLVPRFLFPDLRLRPLELAPRRVGRADGERGGAKRLHQKRFERHAANGHAVRRRLDRERRVGHRGVGQHDVAVLALPARDGNALHERDFRALVRPLDYFQQKIHLFFKLSNLQTIKLHNLSLPSGWMLISALSSWNDRTGSS